MNKDKVLEILSPGGLLCQNLKGFEPRESQKKMLEAVIDAYNQKKIALIEAGTGTGKSMAYLIPALLFAAASKEKTVISTNTIALQQQLLVKDIPLIKEKLGLELKATLVKGMNNYICLKKLDETASEMHRLSPSQKLEIDKIESRIRYIKDGSRSSLSFVPSQSIWNLVGAESDACSGSLCPHFSECFFFKARKQAAESQILVVNHHLLFADLVKKQEGGWKEDAGILPSYDRLILDEAHHIEDVATDYFSSSVSNAKLFQIIAKLILEKPGALGKLPLLKDLLLKNASEETSKILPRVSLDIPTLGTNMLVIANDAFTLFKGFASDPKKQIHIDEESSVLDYKLRLRLNHVESPDWKEIVLPKAKLLIEEALSFSESLFSLSKDLEFIKDEDIQTKIKPHRNDLLLFASKLTDFSSALKNFFFTPLSEDRVRFIECQKGKKDIVCLNEASLDISKLMQDHLFSRFSSIVLCSATLTTNHHFRFIKGRLGLDCKDFDSRVSENIYPSPFDYENQSILILPKDIKDPKDPFFKEECAKIILESCEASKGGAFVLFTSYSMMQSVYQMLAEDLSNRLFTPVCQGLESRTDILNKFKSTKRSVLFGTDSFWEGIDVAGDALRSVIIVKLPFKVPSEPIVQARSEKITSSGGDAFLDYSLPHAIVKFKQGFGRLIRTRFDRGCIVCLDSRLSNKGYGKLFINSLPGCRKISLEKAEIADCMRAFYSSKKKY